MADIALLVTEEYFERKLRRGSGEVDAAATGRRNFGAVITVWSSWMESASAAAAAAAGVKVNVARLSVDEPRTGPAMAASDGFFSA
ncbi:hypothetical protein GUJ93_ZPchr0006g41766 [Zizania palustris]|uniref:Uncharacterized protein n=1 Tax=Zizania palustris TaxID=103762 RepID=A0A8J5VNG2_ZIZPA|nr:hypothetical protein GUJ93_ZPchr0006g41766 [Zizania palustris]